MIEKYSAVIDYGVDRFAQVALGKDVNTGSGKVNWVAYENKLGERGDPQAVLTAILSLVQLPKSPPHSIKGYSAPRALSLTDGESLFPTDVENNSDKNLLNQGWQGFNEEIGKARKQFETKPTEFFETFHYLLRKWGWAVPSTYGEPGISLFEQWKAVAAMVFASGKDWEKGPANEFTLIGGDIPGIQDFVYTITSKGAAKGLRGRSFFIQLLGEAVIKRLLRELDLCLANVIYAAGGNFMLLASSLGTSVNGRSVEKILEDARADMEKALLDDFHGDLALALAWTPLSSSDIGQHDFAEKPSRRVKELIAERKRSRFSTTAANNWEALFAPQGKRGNRYCAVCQKPLARGEGKKLRGEVSLICPVCEGFEKMARLLGGGHFLSIRKQRPKRGETWQETLFRVGGVWFSFDKSGEVVYALNDTDFLSQGARGFRFLANVTPHVIKKDVERWENEHAEGEEKPEIGDVRTFGQMAADAEGMKGLGVLRMDVDNLGQVIIRGLKERNMATTSALSAALEMFFAGYLNIICAEIQKDRPESLYVIYSGGDDLFIVGAWDLMPRLAEKIQTDFGRYTGGNPSLTISGAVTLEGEKFPLYQAAERAGGAEEKAKKYARKLGDIEKNAIHFLGLEVGWEEWAQVTRYRTDIETALAGEKGAPRALLQILQNIYAQYEHQKDKGKAELGPWIWRGAYALSRLAGRIPTGNEGARQAVDRLAESCLNPDRIRFAGLAAGWMELLTRKEERT